jgi:hypothetical protein
MGDTGLGRGVSRSPVAETNVEDDLRLIFKPVVLSCVAANNFGPFDQFRFCWSSCSASAGFVSADRRKTKRFIAILYKSGRARV